MEDRAPASASVETTPQASSAVHHEGRSVWVLTAYGISGLALFGVLAYYFSDFVTR
jgi:hypothetical protein